MNNVLKSIVIVISFGLLYCASPKETVLVHDKCDVVEKDDVVIINCGGEITQIDFDEAEGEVTPSPEPQVTPTPEPTPDNWWVCKQNKKKWICKKEIE